MLQAFSSKRLNFFPEFSELFFRRLLSLSRVISPIVQIKKMDAKQMRKVRWANT